ncbi:MAG: hypothetical protein QMB94_06530 [Phycisphaerales bacterium]
MTPASIYRSVRHAAVLALLFMAAPAVAQDGGADTSAESAGSTESTESWKISRSNNLVVRSGPTSNDYIVTKIKKGDPVLVSRIQDDKWAAVRLTGPTFENLQLLLELDDRIRVEDGMATVIKGKVSLMAPNESSRPSGEEDAHVDPDRSSKPLVRLIPEGPDGAGDRLKITGRFQDGGRTWLLVSPPARAEAWVYATFLEPAKPENIPASARSVAKANTTEVRTPPTVTNQTAPEPASQAPTAVITIDPVPAEKSPTETDDTGKPKAADGTDETDLTPDSPPTEAPTDETDDAVTETPVDPLADVTIGEAEAAWDVVKESPHDDAELEALQLVFVSIAARENASATEKRLAELRIRQIEIRREVQRRLATLHKLENRNDVDRERIENAKVAIIARADYTMVGRLNASRVYDGKRLPLLYRLQDPVGGRTLGYVKPTKGVDLTPGLGRMVGLVGTKSYDAGYRLMIVTPRRFDIFIAENEAE